MPITVHPGDLKRYLMVVVDRRRESFGNVQSLEWNSYGDLESARKRARVQALFLFKSGPEDYYIVSVTEIPRGASEAAVQLIVKNIIDTWDGKDHS